MYKYDSIRYGSYRYNSQAVHNRGTVYIYGYLWWLGAADSTDI